MAYPQPSNVAPWYLRDVCQALQLDEVSGNVFMRTGIQGNVYITGPVTIPGTVTVNSSAEDPVHVHLDEVGTSGILNVPYMPIGGNVVITAMPDINGNVIITAMPPITGNVNANVSGNVRILGGNSNVSVSGNIAGITALPAITGNVNASVTGNVGITGNIAGITALPAITGNVNASVTGNVGITGNIAGITALPAITGNVNASVTGNVGIIGNVNVTQGTNPWVITGNANVTGNVNASVTGNVGITGNANVTGNVGVIGNVNVTQGTSPWVITGNANVTGNVGIVGIANVAGNVNANVTGNVNANVAGNVGISGTANVTGNVNANVSGNVGVIGNVNVTQGTNPWVITGNANVTGNVGILGVANVTGNVNANVTGNVNANVAGNVGVIGNVNVTQGTIPWTVTGNVTTTPSVSVGDFYGEPYSIPITPVVQLFGVYGVNDQDIQMYTALGGTAGASDSCYTASSSATTGSYGLIRSKRFNVYKAGQSLIARFFAKFDTPVAGTGQRIGIQNQESAYYIGYDGTTFGILHTYNSKAPIYRVTITSYTGNQTVTLTLNGVAYTINLVNGETIDNAAQRIALASYGGAWYADQKDNTTELLAGTVGPMSGTFSITSTGNLSATITQLQAGVAATNQWLYDGVAFTKPSWLDPTKFVQYQIKYSWAGANFFALNPNTGQYDLFYQFLWAGTPAATQLPLSNPAFKVAAVAINAGGSTPVTVRVASMMSGLEGVTNRNNYSGGAATTDTGITQNTLHHLLSIQNPYTFYGTINTKEALLDDLTVTTQCNDPTEVYVFLNAPLLGGLQDFKSQNGYSVTVSEANGTIDPATNWPVASFVVGITGSSVQFNLRDYRVAIPPGSTISIAVISTATLQKAAAAVVWYND